MDDKHAEYNYLGTLPHGSTYRLAEFKGSGDQYRAVFHANIRYIDGVLYFAVV